MDPISQKQPPRRRQSPARQAAQPPPFQNPRAAGPSGCTPAGRWAILSGGVVCPVWRLANGPRPQARGRERVSSPRRPSAPSHPQSSTLHRHHQWRRREQVCAGDPLAFSGLPLRCPAPERVWQGEGEEKQKPIGVVVFFSIAIVGFFCLFVLRVVVDEIDRDKQTTPSSSSFPTSVPGPGSGHFIFPFVLNIDLGSFVDAAGSLVSAVHRGYIYLRIISLHDDLLFSPKLWKARRRPSTSTFTYIHTALLDRPHAHTRLTPPTTTRSPQPPPPQQKCISPSSSPSSSSPSSPSPPPRKNTPALPSPNPTSKSSPCANPPPSTRAPSPTRSASTATRKPPFPLPSQPPLPDSNTNPPLRRRHIVFHEQNAAELSICDGLPGGRCRTGERETVGRAGSAVFVLRAVEPGASVTVTKGRWEGCVRAARAVCPTGSLRSRCLGGASSGDVEFWLGGP